MLEFVSIVLFSLITRFSCAQDVISNEDLEEYNKILSAISKNSNNNNTLIPEIQKINKNTITQHFDQKRRKKKGNKNNKKKNKNKDYEYSDSDYYYSSEEYDDDYDIDCSQCYDERIMKNRRCEKINYNIVVLTPQERASRIKWGWRYTRAAVKLATEEANELLKNDVSLGHGCGRVMPA